jgi:dTDP-glucose pyrophosphorylase
MIQIVIPMAGLGRRFSEAGYRQPKPLIPVFGEPMISLVIRNLTPIVPHRFVFIVQREHLKAYDLEHTLLKAAPDSTVIPLDGLTEGAACTVSLAERALDDGRPLLIANCDQYLFSPIDLFIEECEKPDLDGTIMTMRASDPKWSYVATDAFGLVKRVAEKVVISDHATVGIYHFSKAGNFFAAAAQMIKKNLRVNGEFYVAPVYNEMIESGARIGIHSVGDYGSGMTGIGTPEDLSSFISLHRLRDAANVTLR